MRDQWVVYLEIAISHTGLKAIFSRLLPAFKGALALYLYTCLQLAWAEIEALQPVETTALHQADTLKVMNLNLAHGRKDSINQLLVSHRDFKQNLKDIAHVLNQLKVDVVALQEADAPSRWSGNFDHVEELSRLSSYAVSLHTLHATNWVYNFGTALLSRVAFTDELHHTFSPSPPTTNKGFTLGQVAWRHGQDPVLLIDIVSVHLDFSRESVRDQQVAEMISVLTQRDQPLVVMGDFNTDWQADDQVIKNLAGQLELQAYQPESSDLATYPRSGRRLDWILVSRDLEFVAHETLPEILSDHRAIVAILRPKSRLDETAATRLQ